MNELPTTPSNMLKTGAVCARWLLWLVLAAWLTFSLAWGSLHGLIVPRIGQWRGELETEASRVIGVPVRIGQISAESSGFFPSFELRDVRLFDRQGREALHLPRVLATLSPSSALHLSFEQLAIDQLEVDIRRRADGHILVAGLDVSAASPGDGSMADWFFSQSEVLVQHARVFWTDEQRANETVRFDDIEFVMRNSGRRHALQLDASPPPAWGERLHAAALMRQPLLSSRNGQWRDWDGQLYASAGQLDLAALGRHLDAGLELAGGRGALRAWADLSRGQWVGVTADVALQALQTRLAPELVALSLQQVSGRVSVRRLAAGMEVGTEGLRFVTRDGIRWDEGNVFVSSTGAEGRLPAQGQFRADRLDLAAIGQLAPALPLSGTALAALQSYAPRGQLEHLQASWQGHPAAPDSFAIKGRVQQLETASQPAPASSKPVPGIPGVRGASIEFDFNQLAGKAHVTLHNGALDLPGVFEDPLLRLDQFVGDFQWQRDGEKLKVQGSALKFGNADAQAEAQFSWHSADAIPGRGRGPGVLDLSGTLSQGEAGRVHRYLPLVLPVEVRDYVRDAVLSGRIGAARFKVRGDLRDMPFNDPRLGELLISANVQGATYAYVPRVPGRDAAIWPALTQLGADLVFDRSSLLIKDAHGRINGAPGLQVMRGEARLTSLGRQAQLAVTLDARGPLGETLALVQASPLAASAAALARASATGTADYRLALQMPLAGQDRPKVQGSVALAGNDVSIAPDLPALARLRGTVSFSDNGFALSGVQARLLGGDVRIDGGSRSQGTETSVLLRAQGSFSADGLKQARELGFVARLAQNASGSASYSATLGWRRGVPEFSLNSSLQGLALGLPAPLNKAAEQALPLRIETALLREPGANPAQDQLTIELGRQATLVYQRDLSGPEPRVTRGTLAVGLLAGESAPMGESGVVANINLATLDLDAWEALLNRASGGTVSGAAVRSAATSAGLSYLPTVLALRSRELVWDGRKLNNVVAGGVRDGPTWRANLDAAELNGYVEYRQPSVVGGGGGRLYARLARMSIGQGAASDVEALLDEQPSTIPALDIVVDDLDLRGRKLGRVEIEAINRGASAVLREGGAREWRLNRFNIITPEATFSASGNWAALAAQAATGPTAASAPRPARAAGERRRTVMSFKLDITDSGELLARMGMKDVVRRGKGRMEGQVAWVGSPLALDYPSLSGQFSVNVEGGQFLKADPGLAKLLGVLSLQSLPRRLSLDFRDVFSEGFAFDFVRGDVIIEQGIASTNNLQMKGVNAAVLMEGRADIARETQNIKVVVVPEINAGTASLVATAINPAVGLGTFLAQLFLRRPLIQANTQEFHIDGSWADPKIAKVTNPVPAETATEIKP